MAEQSAPVRKKRHNWRPAFLQAFAATGIVVAAARAAGISRTQAYRARGRSPQFAQAWAQAEEEAIEILEAEARRRAMSVSDILLIFLLKARRPNIYRENARLELTGVGGGPIATTSVLDGLNDQERASLRRAIDEQLAKEAAPAEVES
jgi:hypothetical protein